MKRKSQRVQTARERLYEYLVSSSSSLTIGAPVGCLTQSDRHVMLIDIKRSVAHWDIYKHMKLTNRIAKRRSLFQALETLATSFDGFRYYQGLHEVCLVILELCQHDIPQTVCFMHSILKSGLDKFVRDDFQTSVFPLIDAIGVILEREDPFLNQILRENCHGYHFSIPWILTWFAHSLHRFDDICDIFYFILQTSTDASNLGVVYLCAAALLSDRANIVSYGNDSLHTFKAANACIGSIPIPVHVSLAAALIKSLPPRTLVQAVPSLKKNSPKGPRIRSIIGICITMVILGLFLQFMISDCDSKV
jgi:hypothetical protein